MLKRLFDCLSAAIGLIALSPLLLGLALLIKLSSPGPVIFGHERAGRNGARLRVWKFRTMVQNASSLGGPLTLGGHDPRITAIGRFLRKTKLDELPQLFNVLVGQMSLVGPRPEAWKYVDMFPEDFAEILRVRPGITDPASIEFRDEGSLLATSPDPERTYIEDILPQKIRLAKDYIAQHSLRSDLSLILRTVARLLGDRMKR